MRRRLQDRITHAMSTKSVTGVITSCKTTDPTHLQRWWGASVCPPLGMSRGPQQPVRQPCYALSSHYLHKRGRVHVHALEDCCHRPASRADDWAVAPRHCGRISVGASLAPSSRQRCSARYGRMRWHASSKSAISCSTSSISPTSQAMPSCRSTTNSSSWWGWIDTKVRTVMAMALLLACVVETVAGRVYRWQGSTRCLCAAVLCPDRVVQQTTS